MEIKLKQSNIVILASVHSPGVLTPQWIREKLLIAEDAMNFITTPDFSLFETNSFSIMVDPQRLQIVAKKQEIVLLNTLSTIAINYIKLFPNIPFTALGLNFIWSVEIKETEKIPDIELNINKADFSEIFKNCEVNYGGIIYVKKPPYLLKIIIEPVDRINIIHNFNYHHELSGLSIEQIIQYIGGFQTAYEDSSKILNDIYLRT